MILGKTNHPVQIKQIPLHTWSLRSEIEVALATCLNEDGTLDEEKSNKIKEFYDNISYPEKGSVQELVTDNKVDESLEAKEEKEEPTNEDESVEAKENDDNKIDENKVLEPIRFKPDEEHVFMGRSLLSDIQMDTIIFFSEKDYYPGQTISIEIITAKPFCLYLNIENVMNFSRESKVITPRKLGHRILGRFIFPSEEQKNKLRQFLEKIEPNIVTQERLKKMDEEKNKKTDPLVTAQNEADAEKEDQPSDEA